MNDTAFKLITKGFDTEVLPILASYDIKVLYASVIPFGPCNPGDRMYFKADKKDILSPVDLYNLSNTIIYKQEDHVIQRGTTIEVQTIVGTGKLPKIQIEIHAMRIF